MNGRERVDRAMRGKRPDRVPFDLSFGFSPFQLAEFRRRTGEENHLDYFGVDTRMVRILPTRLQTDFRAFFRDLPANAWIDEWGVGRRPTGLADPRYAHLYGLLYPMSLLKTGSDASDYPLPDIEAGYRYEGLGDQIKCLHDHGLSVLGMVECTIFEIAWNLRGMDLLLTDFLEESEFATVLLDRITEKRRIQASRLVELGVDILCLGDDVGTQRGMLMAVPTWQKWLKPRLADIISAARRVRPDLLVFYHSDGNPGDILPDLIKIGVNILNPVQPECMDPIDLKKKFGDQLSLWGTIGTQSVFPFGTPDDVCREVRFRIETVGRAGRLFLAPTHFIESEVPWENITAFVEAVKEFGVYR